MQFGTPPSLLVYRSNTMRITLASRDTELCTRLRVAFARAGSAVRVIDRLEIWSEAVLDDAMLLHAATTEDKMARFGADYEQWGVYMTDERPVGTPTSELAVRLELADVLRIVVPGHRLAAMNPYERRVVHMTIREHPGLTTVSEGDGFLKRVRVEKIAP